jgi:hypothetical protein
LKTFFAIQSFRAFVVDENALTPENFMHLSITPTASFSGQFT